MMELAPRSSENILKIKISHPEKEDRKKATSLLPKIDEVAKKNDHHVRVLVELQDHTGIAELGPIWKEARFNIKHPEDIEKIAFIGEIPAWVELDKILSTCFNNADVKSFDEEHKTDAEEWIKH